MLTARLVSLVCALLSAKPVSSESYLLKCCPPGQLYSGSKLNCTKMTSNATELQVLHANASTELQGYPLCDKPEDIVTKKLEVFASGDYLEVPACLEILHNEKSGESHVVAVFCRSNSEDRQVRATNASFPQVTRVRKCCPREATFDGYKSCVFRPSDAPSLLTFLPNVPAGEDHVLIVTHGPPRCEGPIVDYEIDEHNVLPWNGTYLVTIPTLEHDSIITEEYLMTEENACLDTAPHSASSRKLIARVCREREYCDRNVCIRKCCAEDEFFYGPECRESVGTEAPAEFHPAFASAVNATLSSASGAIEDYGLLIGKPCLRMYPVNPTEEAWSLTSRGHVKVEGYSVQDLDKFCMDAYYNKSHYNNGFHLFICFDDSAAQQNVSTRYKINTALEFTSCAFLLITLLVYSCLPSLQNLHGKTLMCHASSLFLAFICLAIIPWITSLTSSNGKQTKVIIPCKALAYIMLFAFLSAFSWLNVMCFDIWWTFGGLRGDTVTRGRKHRRRFLLYCLYAFGFSLLVSILVIASDCMDILPDYVRPNVGYTSCWFTQKPGSYGEMIFFIGPMTVQLISNVVFFVLTSLHCNKVKAEIRRVTSDPADPRSKRFHSDRNRFVMNIKLFVVMGMSWVCEVVSFFLKRYHVDWQDAIFYVTDVFNCLQGLLIFILFVLKSRVYLALRKRLGLDVGRKRACNTTTLQDPYRVRKSVSNSTLMSTFVVSSAP
ncbi:G-protein coupled receptor Mth2 [Harpegnathos saltator]|uniref:G-protein coupled receptor Mth2 n=2 Tax=Harpegnathos saltator TaxID=610380 RepID=E2BKF8_HARSA|nr:G-protein coupled receptor Mth2 [Harpegnathos saltator]